ncbi:MAG: hypothetical protein ACI4RD_05565 [Kiritimatiellia bacterium]
MPSAATIVLAALATVPAEAPLVQALAAVRDPGVWADGSKFESAPVSQETWMRQANAHVLLEGVPAEGTVFGRARGWTYGIDCEKRELFRLGLGRFVGDVGCVETLFNPWLYSDRVADAPRSTLLVRISGTTPAGVRLARAAFCQGMNNGVVLGRSARRTETSILDLDPSDEPPPADVIAQLKVPADCVYAGWSQCPAQEYRAYLDWGATDEPRRVWRLKYLTESSLASASGATWADSPLLAAFGHAVTIADLCSEANARRVLAGVGPAARAYPTDEVGYGPGQVRFRVLGRYFLMSSLPEEGDR